MKIESGSEEVLQIGLYLLELMRAALTDTKAKEKPEHIAWEDVYALAKRHSVEGLSTYGVETLETKPPKEIWDIWKKSPQYVIYRVLRFDLERETILAKMKEAGLSYLPLKGVHISGYYPKAGMRTMADNDILYGFIEKADNGGYRVAGKNEDEQIATARKMCETMDAIMAELGYEVKPRTFQGKVPGGVHDVYLKAPFYNYEMHRKLVSETNEFRFYYDNAWKRAVQSTADENLYYFKDEDEFIYVLIHAYKHFSKGGCGVRLLSDIEVFLKKKGKEMDWKYIEKELESIGLIRFWKLMESVVESIFGNSGRTLSKEEMDTVCYMVSSGTYGTLDTQVFNDVKKQMEKAGKNGLSAKLSYIWSRMFPPKEWWKDNYPVCYGRPYLYPVLLVYRVTQALIKRPTRTISEWKAIWKRH